MRPALAAAAWSVLLGSAAWCLAVVGGAGAAPASVSLAAYDVELSLPTLGAGPVHARLARPVAAVELGPLAASPSAAAWEFDQVTVQLGEGHSLCARGGRLRWSVDGAALELVGDVHLARDGARIERLRAGRAVLASGRLALPGAVVVDGETRRGVTLTVAMLIGS